MSAFTEAALTYFKCQPDDIEIRMITENKEAFVVHDGQGYKISTREVLREDIAFQLTDKNAAHHINFGCWVEATRNTVEMNKILGKLVRTIKNTEHAKMLLIAVGLGSYAENMEATFWEILSRIDKEGELLGNAIVITAQVYNGPRLLNDLEELQILNGKTVYNQVVDGIFETVYLGGVQNKYPEFYLYSADHYITD